MMEYEKSIIEKMAEYQLEYNRTLIKLNNMIEKSKKHPLFDLHTKGKSINLKFVYIYYSNQFFWFRFWNKYGILGKNFKVHGLIFSERQGISGKKIGNWIFRILRP